MKATGYNYWTTPKGILRRARDKANTYKTDKARANFELGWADAAPPVRSLVNGDNAYSRGWNARREWEQAQDESPR